MFSDSLIAIPLSIDSVLCDAYEEDSELVACWDWKAWFNNGERAEGGYGCSSLNGTSIPDY